jgi:2-polyprenyl-3-methyl-5-hydroxy-6-metoxy-1,4-benzoquinol methylase
MITFSRLGAMGNLGNQLFQIAFCLGLADKHACGLFLPTWQHGKYFNNYKNTILEDDSNPEIELTVKEEHFHYNPELWQQYETDFKTRNVDLIAWGQSRKYWDHCLEDIAKLFEFNHVFSMGLFQKCAVVSYDKPVIAISVRRGDYVNNPNYDLLPASYYIQALLEHFPNFREEYNIIFFSDDTEYCKLHFSCLPNAHFAEGYNAIEQLCLMSMCEHAIIANSTFSWWGAMLIQFNSKYAKIIRPGYLFAGNLLETHDDRDFWPEEWTRHDHKNNKINLKDVTFTIPVSYDSRDRKENVDMCLKYLSDFDTTIIIGEHGPHPRFEYTRETGCQYMRFDMQAFHRTKMLNDMALAAKTSIVANWDADVIVPPMQLIEAVHKIKTRQAQMVYPYDGQFARVPRQQWYQQVMKMGDVGVFAGQKFQGMGTAPKSVGGAILWDMEAFVDCGLENEKMVSYAPEDAERYYRAEKLGVKVHRVDGVIYHLDHLITNNSSIQHEHYRDNMIEYHTIKGMSKEELRTCVDGWPWKKNYTPLYYESIFEESVKSRDVVFDLLIAHELIKAGDTIIDAGCGIGSWGYQMREKYDMRYIGIDFGVPKDKLVILGGHYVDHDLRTPLDITESRSKKDIVLCLEVGEHLEEEHIETFIDNLCLLGGIIVFSAAIPHQGGLHHHTERWQSWWAEKFAARNYYPFWEDIRPDLRKNKDVASWYAQNIIIYCKELTKEGECGPVTTSYELDFIDPKMYENTLKHYRIIK